MGMQQDDPCPLRLDFPQPAEMRTLTLEQPQRGGDAPNAVCIALPYPVLPSPYRVGGGVTPAVLSHHRAYGSVPRRFTQDIGADGIDPSAKPIQDDRRASSVALGFRCEAPKFHQGPRPLVALFQARSSATYPALQRLVRPPTSASADLCPPITPPHDSGSQQQANRSPTVRRVAFTLMPAAYTSAVSVQVPGFEDIGLLTHGSRLVRDSCSSGQCLALDFLSDSTSRWTPLPFS